MQKILKYITVFLVIAGIVQTQEAKAEETGHDRIYTVVVDRFINLNDGNDDAVTDDETEPLPFGGDFAGIEDNLDYIKDMGFNTLMLSPVFEKADEDYLGYDTEEYGTIAESFGGAEGLQSLVDAAHERDMKIVADMPATATDAYETMDNPVLNDIQETYYEDIGNPEFIDFTESSNQAAYKEMATDFVNEFGLDGLSMTVVQDGINAADFLPEDITTYGIVPDDSITAEGFDHTSSEENRQQIANAFSTTDQPIPEFPDNGELLLADHWFTERFTLHAVNEDMFPGTRIMQLATYLFAYPGPIAIQYGTEVAFNGEEYPIIHKQMDLWTDQEVVDYIKEINSVFKEQDQMYNSEMEVLKDGSDGQFVVRYNTVDQEDDTDFVLNVNDTAKTTSFEVPVKEEDQDKIMSGMLIGDSISASSENPEHFNTVLDREETELYAITDEVGLNNGYIIAAVIIFGGFGIFIWLVAKRRKPKKE